VFPTSDIGEDPVAIRDFAQGVEELGLGHLVTYDHVLGADHADRDPPLTGPYTEHDAFHEPFVLFGYLAAVTRQLELVVGVLVLPQRQTALVAKQAAEVALLSGGRLRLGIGSGWNWVEYDALGVPFRARGRRLEEQVDVLRRLWSEPLVTLHGQHHDIERAGILPMPREPIPIWFGGGAEAQLRRAARLGDGFLASRADERARAQVQQLLAFRAEEGRAATPDADTGGFAVAGMLDWAHGPDACGEAIAAWRDAGGTHIALRTFDTLAGRIGVPALGYTSVDEHLDALARFRDVAASVL
jgi:probable F420-dependent oxidoreductase